MCMYISLLLMRFYMFVDNEFDILENVYYSLKIPKFYITLNWFSNTSCYKQ